MNKKGFTLIELLAVIVILGIIAVITTPLIMGVIEDARKNSAIQSVNGLLEAGEQYQIKGMMDGTGKNEIDLTSDTLDIKGSKPESGTLLISASGNMSIIAKYGNYCIQKKFLEEVPSIIESEECEIAQSELEAMDILKSPTFESKTVSENEVTLTYTTEEEQNKIHETVCYYGKTDSNLNAKVTANNNTCTYPATAAYAKVCHVGYSGMESCSDVKKLADYLILDGKMLVEFESSVSLGREDTLDQISYIEKDGYLNLNINYQGNIGSPRMGLRTKNSINLINYAYLYIDWEAYMKSTSTTSSNPSFGLLLKTSDDIGSNNDILGFSIIQGTNVSSGWEQQSERQIQTASLSSKTENGYLHLSKNISSSFELSSNIYNIWLQLTE